MSNQKDGTMKSIVFHNVKDNSELTCLAIDDGVGVLSIRMDASIISLDLPNAENLETFLRNAVDGRSGWGKIPLGVAVMVANDGSVTSLGDVDDEVITMEMDGMKTRLETNQTNDLLKAVSRATCK